MPVRELPLVIGEYYHVFNRGITSQDTFLDHGDYNRAQNTLAFYRAKDQPISLSRFFRLPDFKKQEVYSSQSTQADNLVDLIAYCFMPNHFHLLLRQLTDTGTATFTGQFTNSYTRFFNTKRKRTGPLFQGRFKAVRIKSDEQLTHVSRYIHLNPYTSGITKTLTDLETYPYSSLREYLELTNSQVCNTLPVLSLFASSLEYRGFVFAQADYQRELGFIQHLLIDTTSNPGGEN